MRRLPLLAGLLLALASTHAAAMTQVGFAVRDITPRGSLSGICLGGYGACLCRRATGVIDPVYARAMVIRNTTSGVTVAIVSLDAIGASNRIVRSILAKVNSPRALLPADHILVAETHSHSTPDLVGLWGGVPDAYKAFVTDQAAAAVREAFRRRANANLYVSSGTFAGSHNRRGWDGTDTGMAVLSAESRATGALIGVLINYAAHPTILGAGNWRISRDWVGPMIDRAEAALGENRVMFVNGAQGDVSPSTGATGGATELERAQRYGRAVADRALALLAGTRTLVGDSLRISRAGFTQCVTNQLLLLANAVGCMDYDIQGARGCPRTGLLRSMRIASQVSALRLGEEVQVAVVPGEALTRMSVDGVGAPGYAGSAGSIKSAMKAPVRMVFGMSGDFLGYFVPEDEWNLPPAGRNPDDDSYEETVSLGGDQADTWIRDRVKALIEADNATF